MDIRISPKVLSGQIEIISSKSDAHRVLIAAALSEKPSRIKMKGSSKDIEATISCLAALGAEIEEIEAGIFQVRPLERKEAEIFRRKPVKKNGTEIFQGGTVEDERKGPLLDCGESGSTLRFMIPVAAALHRGARFTGQGRLPERPLSDLLEQMKEKGCTFSADRLPFQVSGRFRGGRFSLPGNVSSQFVTGLLLAAPLLEEDSEILITSEMESMAYVSMTVDVLRRFGIAVSEEGNRYLVKGGQHYRSPGKSSGGEEIPIDGDWSNGAFWLAAGVVGAPVTLRGLSQDSVQGDKAIVEILKEFGGRLEWGEDGAVLTARSSEGFLTALDIDGSQVPDLVPILSVVAAAAKGATKIYNAGRLRMKESDRLAAMSQCLSLLGVSVEELPDALIIKGVGGRKAEGGLPINVSGFRDHRIVMSMAIAAIALGREIIIHGAEAVEKSYPAFFEEFRKLGGEADVL